MDPLILYFIFKADAIHGMFVFFLVASIIVTFIYGLVYFLTDGEDMPLPFPKVAKYMLPFFIIGGLGTVVLPTTNNLIAIYGIHHVTKVASESEQAQELPDNFLKYLNTYLEKETEELMNSENE